jgi:hypothetical protein
MTVAFLHQMAGHEKSSPRPESYSGRFGFAFASLREDAKEVTMAWESGVILVLSVVPFALAMSLSPGPNNIMIAAIASRHGAQRTLPYLLGTLLGISALMLAAGFGLGELFVRWPSAHGWLKTIGVAYLLWLAWRVATASVSRQIAADRPFGFVTGMLFQWLNPESLDDGARRHVDLHHRRRCSARRDAADNPDLRCRVRSRVGAVDDDRSDRQTLSDEHEVGRRFQTHRWAFSSPCQPGRSLSDGQ